MQPMQRFFRLLLYACFMFAVTAVPAAADLNVRSAILMDVNSGRVLYAQDADRRIPPASLAKIMTMYVVMDQVQAGKIRLKDKITISRNAAQQGGSRMHLKAGEKVSLDSLLAGVAVSSGNDAATAVAEHVSGSVNRFVRLMNDKAKKLGLKGTAFSNPHGLPAKGQETTARDMLTLSANYLKAHPEAMRYHRMLTLKHRGVITVNKNPLLNSCPGADGLKTGWIRASGYNLVSTVKRGKTRLVGVVLGSATSRVRADEMRELVEAGFTAVRSGGKMKVDEILSRKSSHAVRRPDPQTRSTANVSGGDNVS
ncbi:MAG: D-alanyl-D-alanine carboxypeptidase [Deltaproteobacteria bacterium]|nr:D-alanyl-D-alanine carboxypeptidase [Deltaproteobacteria bacterium]